MLDGDWPQLLELAETVMGTGAGRGWLDLQRYLLNAFEGLGDDYARAAQAVRGEIRTLLAEIPTLPEMTLMDDLPTAGPSTLAWLKSEGLVGTPGEGDEAPAPRMAAAAAAPSPSADRALERALAEVKAGRTPAAIEMIKRELGRENSERGRFVRQVQLATVMIAAGRDAIAIPGLQRLMGLIETHKLDGWEEGRLVAEPMTLLYRALESTGGDEETRNALYLRICELDPMAAIEFGQPTATGDGEGA
jgi:type VI secretion system protein ImpA